MKYKTSIYFSAFNLIKNKFPYEENLKKACAFADEVVVAQNMTPEEAKNGKDDGSCDKLISFRDQYPNLKLVWTQFSYGDIRFDGAIKNAALQATTHPVKIQMDLDEYIPLSQKPKWEVFAAQMMAYGPVQCLMIPTLDLYGDEKKIRAHSQIGLKFRMHKEGMTRGIMKDAWRGTNINTSMSDTTELLDVNGNVPYSVRVAPAEFHNPVLAFGLTDFIYTVHEGYLSFEHRVNINKAIWKKAWEDRSGHAESTPTDISQLIHVPTVEHGLPLE